MEVANSSVDQLTTAVVPLVGTAVSPDSCGGVASTIWMSLPIVPVPHAAPVAAESATVHQRINGMSIISASFGRFIRLLLFDKGFKVRGPSVTRRLDLQDARVASDISNPPGPIFGKWTLQTIGPASLGASSSAWAPGWPRWGR